MHDVLVCREISPIIGIPLCIADSTTSTTTDHGHDRPDVDAGFSR